MKLPPKAMNLMRVKMISGFRGRETDEVWWPPGSIHTVEDALGERLVNEGKAKKVREYKPRKKAVKSDKGS